MIGAGIPPHALPLPASLDATGWVVVAAILALTIGCFVFGLIRSLRTWPPQKVEAKVEHGTMPKAA